MSSDDRPISKSSSSEEEGLAGALAKALLLRSAALKPGTYEQRFDVSLNLGA